MINYVEANMRCYRTPEWKLVRDFKNPGRDELYHLAEDPKESHNLIQSNRPDIQETSRVLNEKLVGRIKEISP